MNTPARHRHWFHTRIFTALCMLGVLLFAGSAHALPPFGKNRPGNGAPPDSFVPSGRLDESEEEAPSDRSGMSAQQAARQAQAINGGGRVLSVEDANGGWRVKLLKNGNVRFVFVPQ